MIATALAALLAAQGGPTGETQVFFSPHGQPFRAPAGAPYPVGAWFASADADADAALTPLEFQADASRFLTVLDANRNGRIESTENTAYERRLAPEILIFQGPSANVAARSEADAPQGRAAERLKRQEAPRGASPFSLLPEPQPIRRADANLDFVVSADEWRAAATRRFGLLDRDKDGRLTLSELPETYVQRGRRR